MRQATALLTIKTQRLGLLDITDRISEWTHAQEIHQGLLTIFCRHTSASLLIQENAAPEVRADLEAYFARVAPEDATAYAHDDEGPDDMPAHIRTALTQVQLSIPILGGGLSLGIWQAIYLFEHRRRPQTRTLALQVIGESISCS
jgi:secondary thiamine-phosphate synthase enzyme